MTTDPRKAAIIGCGAVGASIAFRFLQQGLFSKLVLVDVNRAKAEGEAMDLSDGLPYGSAMEISAGGYDDLADCFLVVITAGANQKPGETRLDLIGKNTAILKSILTEINARGFQGILLIVSNPVDVLTYAAWKLSGCPRGRVIGSGHRTAEAAAGRGAGGGQPKYSRLYHWGTRGQRAGGLERGQCVGHRSGPVLSASGRSGQLPPGPVVPTGAGQRL